MYFSILYVRLWVWLKHPAFPAPSSIRGQACDVSLGHVVPRECAGAPPPSLSFPTKAGNPVVQRRLGSSTTASGILDRPVEPGDDIEALFGGVCQCRGSADLCR